MIRENQRFHVSRLLRDTVLRQPEGYKMKKSTGIWWRDKLAAMCWRLLHKLSAVEQYFFHEKIYTYTPSVQKEITGRIMEGINEVFYRGNNIEDYCIVMGAEDFAELMSSDPIRQTMTFSTEQLRYQDSSGYRLDYHGLPVHVVPNVGGAAVFPKVIVEKVVRK
jgi:hypothetical protein